jgi:hypothetical protein
MRFLCAIISALALVSAPLVEAQTAVMPRVGSEAELSALSVTLTGLPVIVTNASGASDCDFSSGTGGHVHHCYWCDATSSWQVAGDCALVTQNWTDSAASAWTDSVASAWTNP